MLYGGKSARRTSVRFFMANTVSSMMLSAWFFIAWFLLRGASAMRPSALQRHYILLWLFIGSFAELVFATVLANNYKVASGYFALFTFAAVFIALLLSYVELLSLPSKSAYAAQLEDTAEAHQDREPPSRPLSGTTNGTRSDERYVLPTSTSFPSDITRLYLDSQRTTRQQRLRRFCVMIE